MARQEDDHRQGSEPQREPDRRRSPDAVLLGALCGALEILYHPLFLTTAASVVVFANPRAESLLAQAGSPFRIQRRFLHLNGRKAMEWFEGAGSIDEPPVVRLAVNSPEPNQPKIEYRLMLSRRSLRRRTDPLALFVFETHKPRRVAPAVLRKLYQLTHTECVTVGYLFQGHTVDEVARELSVSINTVRSHMKRIFVKCQVRSQVELVRLLAFGPGVE